MDQQTALKLHPRSYTASMAKILKRLHIVMKPDITGQVVVVLGLNSSRKKGWPGDFSTKIYIKIILTPTVLTFIGSVLHQQDVDGLVQRLQLSGRFWRRRVVIKLVPAPVPPSSSSSPFPSLVLVLHAVAVPWAAASAVVPVTLSAGVQGSSPAAVPPGSIRAG